MNCYVKLSLLLVICVAMSSAQYQQFGFGGYDDFLATSFGAPNYQGINMAAARDPRANRGPVVFPPSPPGDPSQTSGVVVGASGFGFVPPGSQGNKPFGRR